MIPSSCIRLVNTSEEYNTVNKMYPTVFSYIMNDEYHKFLKLDARSWSKQ